MRSYISRQFHKHRELLATVFLAVVIGLTVMATVWKVAEAKHLNYSDQPELVVTYPRAEELAWAGHMMLVRAPWYPSMNVLDDMGYAWVETDEDAMYTRDFACAELVWDQRWDGYAFKCYGFPGRPDAEGYDGNFLLTMDGMSQLFMNGATAVTYDPR